MVEREIWNNKSWLWIDSDEWSVYDTLLMAGKARWDSDTVLDSVLYGPDRERHRHASPLGIWTW